MTFLPARISLAQASLGIFLLSLFSAPALGRDLSKKVETRAFSVIQEALTNSLKHSSHSAMDVRVRRIDDAIEVEVQDAGPALYGHESGVGHGLIGMRERAALYGGKLQAGPRSDGGFEVKAILRLDAV